MSNDVQLSQLESFCSTPNELISEKDRLKQFLAIGLQATNGHNRKRGRDPIGSSPPPPPPKMELASRTCPDKHDHHHDTFISRQTFTLAMMRVDHPVLNDKRGLARHQLNLPIARSPITIQSSSIPVRSTHVQSDASPTTPSPTSHTNVSSRVYGSPLLAQGTRSGSAEWQYKHTPNHPSQATSRHPHISAPRQPSLPRLHVKVPETNPCFSEPSYSTHASLHPHSPYLPYSHTQSPTYSRCTSWSPSQAIPEGHYSKGFTLTNLHRVDKPSSSTSISYTHHHPTPSSTGTSTTTSSSGFRRSQTVHKPESTSPFKRLVGRSKSMKVKTMTPIVVSAMDTETSILGNGNGNGFAPFDKSPIHTQPRLDNKDNSQSKNTKYTIVRVVPMEEKPVVATKPSNLKDIKVKEMENEKSKANNNIKQDTNHARAPSSTVNLSKPLPSPPISGSKPRPTIVSSMVSHTIVSKPLWQHTMTNAEEISTLGLNSQDVQKQETIFELIYTEGEYLEDLKGIYRVFVEDLNVKMAENRRKKRTNPEKADVRVFEKLSRLLSHIKDLWNGHQSLLNFYMFSIYDSYFAQYSSTCKEFQYIMNGNTELALVIKELLKSPKCKSLTLEGVLLKPIQRLQKYPLFFKDLMSMTAKTHPDYFQLEKALTRHQRELTKIDDRIWVEEHNEMLTDLQQRIKGLPSNFSLVEQHRYLILDGPVYRIAARQPSKTGVHKSGSSSDHLSTSLPSPGIQEWRDGYCSPNTPAADKDKAAALIQRPSQLDFHHLHAKPAYPSSPSSSASSSSLGQGYFLFPASPKKNSANFYHHHQRTLSCTSPASPPSATTLTSLSSVAGPVSSSNLPYNFPNASSPSTSPPSSKLPSKPSVSALVANYNYLSSSFSNLSGHPRNISSSALHLPGSIKNSTDVEAEYHVFIFTDIVLWTKRVMSRYHRKEGAPWNFKLVEPVSRLTSVCNTAEDNIFMCTSVNTNSTSYLVRTEDEIAARMWRTTIPTLVPFHCSRNLRDHKTKR
ncbi:hypothetical protein BG003_006881 [Podila horticola]|nr:hypothetical protein BG003_006881 [Podila horticola]